AVQMRFGDRHDAGALDVRLVKAGLGVSVDTLVTVFADHHPGEPAVSRCPACGYVYPDGVTDCPTNVAVRPVLYRRRTENHRAVDRLTAIQFADLHNRKSARSNRAAAARAAARPAPSPDRDT